MSPLSDSAYLTDPFRLIHSLNPLHISLSILFISLSHPLSTLSTLHLFFSGLSLHTRIYCSTARRIKYLPFFFRVHLIASISTSQPLNLSYKKHALVIPSRSLRRSLAHGLGSAIGSRHQESSTTTTRDLSNRWKQWCLGTNDV